MSLQNILVKYTLIIQQNGFFNGSAVNNLKPGKEMHELVYFKLTLFCFVEKDLTT